MAFSKTLAEMEQNVPDSDARKKLNALFDEDSFNELDKFLSADGAVGSVVSGYGTVNGATVYAYAQDVSVKGGAVDKSAALKIKKLYELAAKNGAPVVAVFDSKGGAYLENYTLFDIYEGAQIKPGYKSIAYSLTFRAKDKTLEDVEITAAMKKILNGLEQLGIELRQ